jgi:hypothetical protein
MSTTQEVISAFLDDEAFDGQDLAAALSEPEGRELLLDLVALRNLTQPNVAQTSVPGTASQRPPTLRMALAAAAVIVAMAGGYVTGQLRGESVATGAPPATRIVEASAAWQDVPSGGMR